MYVQIVKNSVDPDQLALQKPADLDLHCFQNRIYLGSVWARLIIKKNKKQNKCQIQVG